MGSIANTPLSSSSPTTHTWNSIACDQTGNYVAAGTEDGSVYITQDGGTSWTRTTFNLPSDSNSITQIVMSNSVTGLTPAPTTLAVLDDSGYVYKSADFGQSWTTVASPDTDNPIRYLTATNATSSILVGLTGIGIYLLDSSTLLWTSTTSSFSSSYNFQNPVFVSNYNGNTNLITGVYDNDNDTFYNILSTDFGTTWAQSGPDNPPSIGASDSTGQYLVGVFGFPGNIYTTSSGLTITETDLWVEIGLQVNPDGYSNNWGQFVSNTTGQYLATVSFSGIPSNTTIHYDIYLYTSVNGLSGTSTSFTQKKFITTSTTTDVVGIAGDSTGLILWISVYNGYITKYTSVDQGATWSQNISF